MSHLTVVVAIVLLAVTTACRAESDHWAVLVSSSRYWHNYRHSANVLSFYRLCKQNGISDSRILLFLGDNVACSPRNVIPGTVYNNGSKLYRTNLYDCDTQVDYSGLDVHVGSFLAAMQGRFYEGSPISKRLLSTRSSSVLVYLTGHGGEGFLKFQDVEYLHAEELGTMLQLMWAQGLYGKMLLVVETCHAASMCAGIRHAPNVACVASSRVDEESYSHHRDVDLGVDVIDTFTYETLVALQGRSCGDAVYQQSIAHFFGRSGVQYRGSIHDPINVPGGSRLWSVAEFLCDQTVMEQKRVRTVDTL